MSLRAKKKHFFKFFKCIFALLPEVAKINLSLPSLNETTYCVHHHLAHNENGARNSSELSQNKDCITIFDIAFCLNWQREALHCQNALKLNSEKCLFWKDCSNAFSNRLWQGRANHWDSQMRNWDAFYGQQKWIVCICWGSCDWLLALTKATCVVFISVDIWSKFPALANGRHPKCTSLLCWWAKYRIWSSSLAACLSHGGRERYVLNASKISSWRWILVIARTGTRGCKMLFVCVKLLRTIRQLQRLTPRVKSYLWKCPEVSDRDTSLSLYAMRMLKLGRTACRRLYIVQGVRSLANRNNVRIWNLALSISNLSAYLDVSNIQVGLQIKRHALRKGRR